jgi:hypothetical protein
MQNILNRNRKILMLPTAVALLLLTTYSTFALQENHQNNALAFPHAVTVVNPPEDSPPHVKPVTVVLGHSNEPTFGVLPGVHDGKHGVEVFLEDQATVMPLAGAELTVDKYYFKNFNNFAKATSLAQADSIQKNVALGGVFGDPGHYISRQVQQPGIYGYRLFGTINYFDEGTIPVDLTVFCSNPAGDTSKFNIGEWFGGYGCTDNIKNIYFPPTFGSKPEFRNRFHDLVQERFDFLKEARNLN